MRDIVGVGIDKLQMKKSYTPDNLEKVREEWVLYVQTFIECEYQFNFGYRYLFWMFWIQFWFWMLWICFGVMDIWF